MKYEKIESLIENIVLENIKDTDLELVDVEYVKERDWFLRIYLDKPGGLEIEDCQFVNRFLTKYLDEKDPIKDKYYLEVSSPGLDRQLKKPKDFLRHAGQLVDVHFFKPQNGSKIITGNLGSVNEDILELCINGDIQIINRADIAIIKLHLNF